jgi:DNA polymerase delta subunit 4
MAPVKKTTSLRQGTLSFATAKPTAATISAKQKSINTVTVAPTSSKKRAVESSSEDSDEIESSSTPPPAKAEEKAHSKGHTLKASAETRAEPVPFKSKDATENSRAGKAAEEPSRPELNPKDRKYNKHYMLVRDKMGRMPPSESRLTCLMLLSLILC